MTDKVKKGWSKSAETQRMPLEKVLEQFKAAHGNYYDYSKMCYLKNKSKVEIVCPIHGSFWQTPGDHKRGSKCPQCATLAMAEGKTFSPEDNLKSFISAHGDKYDYSNVEYRGSHEYVRIGCKEHGEFLQAPAHHRKGRGCPKCGEYGFNPEKPALLYYVKVVRDCATLYKVGITNRTVRERFGPDMKYITILDCIAFEEGAKAYAAEQAILNKYAPFRYDGQPLLISGNTELLTCDIGGLVYE